MKASSTRATPTAIWELAADDPGAAQGSRPHWVLLAGSGEEAEALQHQFTHAKPGAGVHDRRP